jgi:hypothetical protein
MLLVVAGLLVAVLAGAGLMFANRDTSGPLSTRLLYRLDALVDILNDGKKNASSDKLRKVTSEASILLAGDLTAIEAALPEQKGKDPADIVDAESSDSSLDRLKVAKINGVYDSAYDSELTAKLESSNALVRELYDETRNKPLREALRTLNQHLVQLQKDLSAKQ